MDMKKYNLSKIMKRAWEIKKEDVKNIFSICLQMAWKEIKKGVNKMKELIGSEKQIEWAGRIRTTVNAIVESIKVQTVGRKTNEILENIIWFNDNCNNASMWIELKDMLNAKNQNESMQILATEFKVNYEIAQYIKNNK